MVAGDGEAEVLVALRRRAEGERDCHVAAAVVAVGFCYWVGLRWF